MAGPPTAMANCSQCIFRRAARTPNGARARFFIEGAEVAPWLDASPTKAGACARAIVAFDGKDEDELAAARLQWKELKARGLALTYWRQNDSGRWEKLLETAEKLSADGGDLRG